MSPSRSIATAAIPGPSASGMAFHPCAPIGLSRTVHYARHLTSFSITHRFTCARTRKPMSSPHILMQSDNGIAPANDQATIMETNHLDDQLPRREAVSETNTDSQPNPTTNTLRVAYQGEPGAYSHQASCDFFQNDNIELVPCASFPLLVEAVHEGHVDRAVLPIENCQAGTIHANLDLLLRHPRISIVGELDFAVRHCLLALPGVKFSDIKLVRSHYMALDQCDGFIRDNHLKSEIAYDTAGSAKILQEERQQHVAAIAGRVAAETYKLNILKEDIQNDFRNFTRFLILSTKKAPYVPHTINKTSLAFCLDNSPGVLWRALSVFGALNIDMTKIESRHIFTVRKALGPPVDDELNERRWGYVFYADFLRHSEEPSVAAALIVLQQMTTFYRVLGSYPSHKPDADHPF